MKGFLLFVFLFAGVIVWNQTPLLVLKSFVKQDTVLLRWAPSNADMMMQGLLNGYTLEQIEGSGNFENNQSLQIIQIRPFSERKSNYLESDSQSTREFAEFLNSLISGSLLSADAKDMAFFSLMLGASSNRDIAEMLGVFYSDFSSEKTTFSYRVSINKTSLKSDIVTVDSGVTDLNKPMSELSGSARPKLKQAYLNWEAVSLQKDYGAYWIERSTDSIHFSKRNSIPYIFFKTQDESEKTHCDYIDTNVVEGQIYYYRITGINHFAETGQTTNIVSVYVPKSIYGEVHIDTISANGFERNLSGEFVGHRNTNELKKFVLLRSDSLLFGYKVLAEHVYSENKFNFTSTVSIESGDRYYYKVAAVGTDHDTVYSYPSYFFTLDQIPPAVPLGLHGEISDSGIVHLAWKLNDENDIRGYRVYRSNALKEEFVEVTKIFCNDSIFHDTLGLRNLTPEVYYAISAVDLNYNNSKICKPVKLLKPDTIPPVAAVFKAYEVGLNGLDLKWNNSSSIDVTNNVLLRKNNSDIDTLLYWSDTTSTWTDTTGSAGESYYYIIVTTDKSRNISTSENLFINYETGVRPGVSNFQIKVSREEKQIELTWKLPPQEIYSIQIYRAKNDGSFTLYKTLHDLKAASFIDKNLSMNNTYSYKIKVVYKSGISSVLSNAVSVMY